MPEKLTSSLAHRYAYQPEQVVEALVHDFHVVVTAFYYEPLKHRLLAVGEGEKKVGNLPILHK